MTKRKLSEVILATGASDVTSKVDNGGFRSLVVSIPHRERLLAEEQLMAKKFKTEETKRGDTTVNNKSKPLKKVEEQIQRLTQMSTWELLKYNIDNIDEEDLFQRAKTLIDSEHTPDLVDKLKSGMTVWAEWTLKGVTIMWPSELITPNRPNAKISIKYIEQDKKKRYVIKKNASQVKSFFDDKHFDYKV
jgi:hypothetical protein